MKKRLFPLLIALSAVAVSGSAAFYSVFGLSKLFAGASTQVIIMAGSLEFAKLVVASLLYQYWDTINKWLRTYLAIACFVLILITSGGIYGFLSGAYQSTATQSELLDKSLMILNQKQVRFQETKEDLTLEKTQINKSISDLRISLSNPQQVSWYDKNSETVITSTSSSARRALQSELKTTIADRDGINIKIEAVMDSINKTDMALLDKEMSNEAESELGPLKYLAETTGKPMNEVVNWFLLLIIFVFDPLAIALVVAANMAFAQIKKNRPVVRMSVPEGMEFNKPYTIEKKDLVMDDMEDTPREELNIDEKRMNVIGQNGNDGLHYDDIDTPLDRLTDTTQTLIVNKKDKVRVINSEKDLNDEELNELSREIGKTEIKEEIIPINPTKEELEKLAKVLNIKYSDENVELDRLTDTTQTLEHKIVKTKDSKDKNTLKYEGRK
jgi:hypothetical protein|tara:strand:+ start:1091 stop:2416 length:1326 start_codon:yes stop_codon:yes gene_type:complete